MKKFIAAYDIAVNNNRVKAAKILEDYGYRVQYSVFEIEIETETLEKLIYKLKKIINPKTDSVIFYYLCKECSKNTVKIGMDKQPDIPDVMVI